RGFTPIRAARRCAENFPKPVKFTCPPPVSSFWTVSRNASTALPASLLDSPACAATRSTNSCLVTRQPSLGSGTDRSVTAAADWLNHAGFAGLFQHLPRRSLYTKPTCARRDARERLLRPAPGRPHRRHYGTADRPRGAPPQPPPQPRPRGPRPRPGI